MKGLIKRVRENKKGFTLAELLVVVAIVGILVAISIPIFTAQLAKARRATNNANLRAAKAAAIAEYLTSESTDDAKYKYEVASGEITDKAATIPTDYTEVTINSTSGDDKVDDTKLYKIIYIEITSEDDDEQTLNSATATLHAKKGEQYIYREIKTTYVAKWMGFPIHFC